LNFVKFAAEKKIVVNVDGEQKEKEKEKERENPKAMLEKNGNG
jgi:hypothetical protein